MSATKMSISTQTSNAEAYTGILLYYRVHACALYLMETDWGREEKNLQRLMRYSGDSKIYK